MRTVPPLVAAYLADLDRRLSGADPAERADIVDSVREHIDVALDELEHEPTGDDVQRILADLGPVDAVVAAWSPDTPARSRRSAARSPTRPSASSSSRSAAWRSGLVLAPVSLVVPRRPARGPGPRDRGLGRLGPARRSLEGLADRLRR